MSSVLTDRSSPPDAAALARVLGRSLARWQELSAGLVGGSPPLLQEWKHYGAKYGWQLKVTRQKKTVVNLVPHEGSFLATLALSDAAVERLGRHGVPAKVAGEIAAGKRFPEGRAARVEVRTVAETRLVQQLVAAKLDDA